MLADIDIELPDVLVPVFATDNVRYRGAFGGRGSGKTRAFALMCAIRAVDLAQSGEKGAIICGREFQNSLDESSLAEIKAAIWANPWLEPFFEIGEKYIRTADGNIKFIFCGLRHNLNSIKSKARVHLIWIDEAAKISEEAWRIITPTIRETGSEIWITWNPELDTDPTYLRFVVDPPDNSVIVQCNYSDNPFFPDVLEQERLSDLRRRPGAYKHIWEGEFISDIEGALFIEDDLLVDGRPTDWPLYCDGVFAVIDSAVKTGKKHDATAVTYFAESKNHGSPLTILDWDKVKVDGALLETWLPQVYDRLEELAAITQARYGAEAGVFIEDKASGSVLLQQCKIKAHLAGLAARSIDSKLTALGKDERALKASSAVFKGRVKIAEYAYNKTKLLNGVTKNHFISEITSFSIGNESKEGDDLLDTFTYGILISKP